MRLLFPYLSKEALPAEPKKLFERIQRIGSPHGFVCAELPSFDVLLLTYDRMSTGCVAVYGNRFQQIPVPEFFAALVRAERVNFFETDARLLRCLAVLFQKEATERIPIETMKRSSFQERLAHGGTDKVVLVQRDDLRSLIYCKNGEPYALYPAPGEVFLDAPTVADRLERFVFKDHAGSTLHVDVYEDLNVDLSEKDIEPAAEPPAAPVTHSAEPQVAPSLVVKLGERVLAHYPITGDMTIGRDPDNHITLDNLSVSRVHAKVSRDGGRVLVEDLSSANGVIFNGDKVAVAELGVGDAVQIGKFTLQYPHYEPTHVPADARVPITGPRSVVETFAFTQKGPVPVIEVDGKEYKIGGLVFVIGKGETANLRIDGMWVAPQHARIIRDPSGEYFLQHVAGLAGVRVNGKRFKKEQLLRDRDEITIGRRRFRFRVPDPAESLAATSTISDLA